jgi:hypothetical protein
MRSFRLYTILFIPLFILILPASAFAYVNPGIGSIAFQIIIAILVTGAFLIKMCVIRIKTFLLNRFGKNKKKSDNV